jgi:multicomponent Na+:H+ antiporter subunit F
VTPADLVSLACLTALAIVAVSLLFALYRVVRGPTLPDRVVAVDMLSYLVIAYVAILVVVTGKAVFLDAAATLALVAFLATVAFARYIDRWGGGPKGGSRARGEGENRS